MQSHINLIINQVIIHCHSTAFYVTVVNVQQWKDIISCQNCFKSPQCDSEDAQVVNNNSSFQNYTNPDNHTQQTTDTPGFKPFTVQYSNVYL